MAPPVRGRPLIALVGSDPGLVAQVRPVVDQLGYRTAVVTDAQEPAPSLERLDAALVVLAVAEAEPADLRRRLGALRARRPETPLIVVAGQGSEELVLAAWRGGAIDYLRAPVAATRLETALATALGHGARSAVTEATALIAESPAMRRVLRTVARVAPSGATVLLTGETGTGKELVARLVHESSARRDGPFVAVNCAAIPNELIESELFGHERGAFTGAHVSRAGVLRQAHGGTLLLDEVGDMGAQAQAKVLRALETRAVTRLGGRHAEAIDARIIAATNHDLARATDRGDFRRDLFYRLAVVEIALPPLRDRRDDIGPLVEHYRQTFGAAYGRPAAVFTAAARRRLREYGWPGNVRELRNVVEASILTSETGVIDVADLPARLAKCRGRGAPEDERARVLEALTVHNWNKSRAARDLRWSRMTLYRKLVKYHLPAR